MNTDRITKLREAELFAAEQLHVAHEKGFFNSKEQKAKTVLEGGLKANIIWYPNEEIARCYVYNTWGERLTFTEWFL